SGTVTPVARVPMGDPMVLLNNNENTNKTNAYRRGVDQMQIGNGADDGNTARYCRQFLRVQPARLFNPKTMPLLANFKSPDAGAANSLFTFLAQRYVAAYGLLNCAGLINQQQPITVNTDGNGVAISATLNQAMYAASLKAL